ncbi:VOC family protein [Pseudoroseomonas globiformis]|uniref:VOC family protein n=1 Tax=Teichococcus globiformis TaxID=2307229 RepID=A0ABV7G7A9_9PROT
MAQNKAPPLGGILETGLYVADLERGRRFYEDIMGLRPVFADVRLVAYRVAPGNMLLLFAIGTTEQMVRLPGGSIPPHGGRGHLHYAFGIEEAEAEPWAAHLARHGIAEEARMRWPSGAFSLYFRDPDGHLVELATPGLWPEE